MRKLAILLSILAICRVRADRVGPNRRERRLGDAPATASRDPGRTSTSTTTRDTSSSPSSATAPAGIGRACSRSGIAKLNLLRPEFVMSVGDLIEGYTKDEARDRPAVGRDRRFHREARRRRSSTSPATTTSPTRCRRRSGASASAPAYYHFVYRDVLFLCLNTYDPESRLSSEQIAYVAGR